MLRRKTRPNRSPRKGYASRASRATNFERGETRPLNLESPTSIGPLRGGDISILATPTPWTGSPLGTLVDRYRLRSLIMNAIEESGSQAAERARLFMLWRTVAGICSTRIFESFWVVTRTAIVCVGKWV